MIVPASVPTSHLAPAIWGVIEEDLLTISPGEVRWYHTGSFIIRLRGITVGHSDLDVYDSALLHPLLWVQVEREARERAHA